MLRFIGILLVLLALHPRLDAAGLFLFLEGIPGESRSARHLDWIEPLGLDEGVIRPTAADRPTFSPLVIRKRIDKSSPYLMLACASGKPIAKAVLDVVRPGDDQLRYLQIKLTDVLVSSFQQGGPSDAQPTEEFSLNFTKVSWTYTQIDAGGEALRSIACSWDRITGTGKGEIPPADGDNDGLPDDYERLYGLNPEAPDAGLDADDDGLSNLDEFRAGTLPNQKDSVFRAEGTRVDASTILLRWTSAPERSYRILGAASLDGPFEFVRLAEPATPGDAELAIETTAEHRFFVVELE